MTYDEAKARWDQMAKSYVGVNRPKAMQRALKQVTLCSGIDILDQFCDGIATLPTRYGPEQRKAIDKLCQDIERTYYSPS